MIETSTPEPSDPPPPLEPPTKATEQPNNTTPEPKQGSWLRHHRRFILIASIMLVIGGTAGTGAYLLSRHRQVTSRTSSTVATKPTAPLKPITQASPLTGLQVAPELASRPITAVVIENQTDARPQSGLSQAGVVYEALAEGGITRFLAFYLEQTAPSLGPVRSIRTYFVDWALEFGAPVAHAGGNADALDLIAPLHMKDMNEFTNGTYFQRSSDRYAPHNLYTSSAQLDKLEQALGYFTPSSFTPSPRKPDTPATAATPAPHPDIKINYSYNGYQVEYQYATATNDYARFLAGAPHIDRNTSAQIHVKNIVVEVMPTSYGTTRIGEQTVIMGTPGSGRAIVFRDGTAVEGTWTKTSHTDRTRLLDSSGQDIPLDAGNTWYSIVTAPSAVTY